MTTILNTINGVAVNQGRSNSVRENENVAVKNSQQQVAMRDDAVVTQLRSATTQRDESKATELARSIANRVRREGGSAFLAQAGNIQMNNVARNLA